MNKILIAATVVLLALSFIDSKAVIGALELGAVIALLLSPVLVIALRSKCPSCGTVGTWETGDAALSHAGRCTKCNFTK